MAAYLKKLFNHNPLVARKPLIRVNVTLHGVPAAQAFEETQRFAKSMGIWTIWINDSDRLFEMALSQ
jgi:hypothetical protein